MKPLSLIDPVTAITTTVRLWAIYRPIRFFRNRRRAKRGLPPLTDEDAMKGETLRLGVLNEAGEVVRELEREEPLIPARTSSKLTGVGITSLIAAGGALIPFYDEANALIKQACESENGPVAVLIGMGLAFGISVVTTRLTKSPLEPGKV
jgi:hypothetical protein